MAKSNNLWKRHLEQFDGRCWLTLYTSARIGGGGSLPFSGFRLHHSLHGSSLGIEECFFYVLVIVWAIMAPHGRSHDFILFEIHRPSIKQVNYNDIFLSWIRLRLQRSSCISWIHESWRYHVKTRLIVRMILFASALLKIWAVSLKRKK